MGKISYNEYKYLVTNEKLCYVHNLLHQFHGDSDSFPEGFVDSIYYDNLSRDCFNQCLEGEPQKVKFRIRGYGNDTFSQLHLKKKDVFGVSKIKAKILYNNPHALSAPAWEFIPSLAKQGENLDGIFSIANQLGHLIPAIRVRYYRYRYRIHDYRVTLDTRIEIQGYSNGWDKTLNYAVLPYHVLELKTLESRPVLPFMNIIQLPQISFSKFFLGSQILENGIT